MRFALRLAFVVVLCSCGAGVILIVRGCDLSGPKVEVGSVVIYSKDTDRATRLAHEITRFSDRIIAEYGEALGLKKARKISIRLFPNREEFSGYTYATTHSEFVYNGGIYNPIKQEIAIIDNGDFKQTMQGLFHEVTHLLMDLGNKDVKFSPWISEGIAMFFEESSLEKERLGGLNQNAVKMLQSMKEIRPSELLIASQQVFYAKDNVVYYYYSHLLVYFLITESYRENFLGYIAKERKLGRPDIKHFKDHVADIPELEKEFREFLKSIE